MIKWIVLACLLAAPSLAQDRQGNDTPGEWRVTHTKAFGLWDVICDERATGDVLEERCYLRYVDVFSPRPNFAAMFAFVTPDGRIEFGIERGTAFRKNGFRLERDGQSIWSFEKDPCLFGGTCAFVDGDATEMTAQMIAADSFIFDFVDRHGTPRELEWDMTRFGEALDEMLSASKERGI